MNSLCNQRIIANAGSGKTYRLVSRYLELLKREVPAERIVALTFTRKAAGEFLDRIFHRLLDGIGNGDEGSGLTGEECGRYLRELVEKMPRLTLGTLDSFFGRMIRAFPFECGLAGDIAIMDGHALNVARREALDALFRGHADEASFAAFLDLIRQQNRNAEGRDVTETLGREIDALHEGFLMTPDGVTWGDAGAIWPEGNAFFGHEKIGDLVEAFERLLFDSHSDMDDKYRGHWEALLDDMRFLRRGAAVPERAIKFALRVLDPPAAPKEPGAFYLTVFGNKRFLFPDRNRDLVMALGRVVLRIELEGRLARSRALYDLVGRFEHPYQNLVRDAGRLTFADITGLLAAADGAAWKGGAVTGFDRQAMDFRLDATYDHWLLDEFQDTSRLQWQALRNLVDEVVQSDTGRRSFFYVGDTKQAIYTWRGGDPWLFDEIAEYYNASGTERIDTSESLDISYRSVPEILQTVNALFDPSHLRRLQEGMGFPSETLARWENAWREHKAHRGDSGYVEWRVVEVGDETRREALDRETARLIADIDPLARGYTCAVLVKSNARAISILNALNAVGLEARSEGRFNPCTDNDPGAVLLALLRAIAHPADRLSLQHVRMTPLRGLVEDMPAFRLTALGKIREEGFAGAVAEWSRQLAMADNPFARDRLGDFYEAAEEFDAAYCGGTIDEFVEFMTNKVSTDDPALGAIRVLTIHASKGLDFDMVVLPDGDEGVMAARRDDAPVHLHTQRDGRIVWGLDLPSRAVCEVDEVLSQAYEEALAGDTYENLCMHYVATTRAKKALYLLSEKLPESSSARTFTRLLRETLSMEAGVHAVGNPEWYSISKDRPLAVSVKEGPPFSVPPLRELRPARPSGQTAFPRYDASQLLSAEHSISMGREVHRALACVEWLDQPEPAFGDIAPRAVEIVRKFLSSPLATEIFHQAELPPVLWRERAFDVKIDDRWISGIFDRVHIHDDRAEIFDFKLDGSEVGEIYREQMSLYRQALSVLTGLSAEKISADLVVLKTGERTRL